MRVAAVDCGTNTVKLLVADLDAVTGTATEVVREMRMVRLGQDVDRTGRLADAALVRTMAAVEEYAALMETHGVPLSGRRFCATSAVRDAANAAEFADGVRSRIGVGPEVVSGAEEAALSYRGATRSLVGTDVEWPLLVVDVGGGSTEVVTGDPETGEAGAARSLDVGSVRLTERLMPSDPPTLLEAAAAVATVEAALDELPEAGVHLGAAGTVVGVAGTVTTVAAAVLDLPAYDRSAIDGAVLPVARVHEVTDRLLAMTVAQRRALPFMHPGRADVIAAGAVVLDRVLRRTRVEHLRVSESDILDGIAWSLLQR